MVVVGDVIMILVDNGCCSQEGSRGEPILNTKEQTRRGMKKDVMKVNATNE